MTDPHNPVDELSKRRRTQHVQSGASELREWASGSYQDEAAVELLVRAFDGRFASGESWIRTSDHGRRFVDYEQITEDNIGSLAGGEQRYLRIVASIGGGTPVDLNNNLSFNRELLDLVLAGVAHAAGSHEMDLLTYDNDGRHIHTAVTLHPWPQ